MCCWCFGLIALISWVFDLIVVLLDSWFVVGLLFGFMGCFGFVYLSFVCGFDWFEFDLW